MREELEPCPFCGGEATRITLTEADGPDNVGGDVICCTRCNASSHVEFGRKENLVSAWNTRAQPPAPLAALSERDALKAEIERLRAANGILEDGLQEVGDDYPGSSCQEWCQHQIKMALAALEARS